MRGSDPMRCTATSRQRGERCRQRPIPGGAVCVYHGGKAPQVQAKAEERLRALAEGPAIARLAALIESGNEAVALGAVKDVLDRAGFAAKQRIEFTLRTEAKRLAEELGLSEAEVLAEAERIVRGVEVG